ncbi:MAG TPA: hypothetical protein VGE44_16695 [Daejeonella sp.]|uniref:hypothetical protein n=1 Tax=Daejeonella sp. TaxID=2805397 RepID=UPI002ED7F77E
MNTHADKTRENKSQSVSNGLTQKEGGSESSFQFADNRPEAIEQRKMQELANASSQVSQLRAFQEMANNSPQLKQANQQPIQRVKNNTDQQESDNNSQQAKDPAKLKRSEIMRQKLEAGSEEDGPSSITWADYAKQLTEEEEEEEWDDINTSDTAEILPGMKEFAMQTDAGFFAGRDDLLKEIDKCLEQCNLYREKLISQIVEVNDLEKDAKADEDLKIRKEKGARIIREFYNNKLGFLEKSVEKWLEQFQDDTSGSVMHRRTSIKALLPAIKSEKEMTVDERVQSVKEKEVKEMERAKKESEKKEKANAEVRSRPPFTSEEFKAEAQLWVVVPFSNISAVVSGLKAFHAIPEPRGDDSIRLAKLDACQKVRSAADAAFANIRKLKEHPGYDKGHTDFEKKSHDIRGDALVKLLGQCQNYYNTNRTDEEKAARKAELDAEQKSR